MLEQGHDLLGHGWRWLPQWELSREQEAEQLDLAIASYERLLRLRPDAYGWNSRSFPSVHTRELLAERGFLYDSDPCNDDLPYWVESAGRKLLVIPYSKTLNDSRYLVSPGFATPGDFAAQCCAALDELLRDAAELGGRMMTVAVHARWSGQPARTAGLREFVEYARAQDGARFMRRNDLARWWIEHGPGPMSLLAERFAAANPRSRTLHEQACALLPSGITHDVRRPDPFPLTILRRRGSTEVGRRWARARLLRDGARLAALRTLAPARGRGSPAAGRSRPPRRSEHGAGAGMGRGGDRPRPGCRTRALHIERNGGDHARPPGGTRIYGQRTDREAGRAFPRLARLRSLRRRPAVRPSADARAFRTGSLARSRSSHRRSRRSSESSPPATSPR